MGILDDLSEKAKEAKDGLLAKAKEQLEEGASAVEQRAKEKASQLADEGMDAFKKKTGG